MDERIVRFPRHAAIEVVAGTGVRLEFDGQHVLLRGTLSEHMAPLLRRGATRDELRAELRARASEAAVDRGLDRLLAAGLVVDRAADDHERRHESGYWERAGLDSDAAGEALRRWGVRTVTAGADDTDVRAFEDAVRAQGIRFGSVPGREEAVLTVVLASSFLDPHVEAQHNDALRTGAPWMAARLSGESGWVSPVFEPGRTACWTCLTQRLRQLRSQQPHLATVTVDESAGEAAPAGETMLLPGDVRSVSATAVAARLAVLRLARWIAGIRDDQPSVLTFDSLALETRKHRVTRRPQCPDCGDPTMMATAAHRPLELRARGAVPGADGGHRARGQDDLLRAYGHLVSPVTGVVSALTRMETGSSGLHVYTAGHNFALGRPRGHSPARRVLRTESAGKGMSDVQARASALGEAVERYSGVWQGDEARTVATCRALGADAVPLPMLQHFSERQFRDRERWRRRGTGFTWVPDPFDETRETAWTPVWSLTENRHKYVPSAYLYYGFPTPPGPVTALAHSNGNAAGGSLEDAVLQGFLELVERDSVALWWYNRAARPEVALDGVDLPYAARWQAHYAAIGRETWILDLTSDLGVPVVAAVSRRVRGPSEDILFGFGAHFDPAVAISRAMTEMNQFLAELLEFRASAHDTGGDESGPDAWWWRTATVENQPYLAPRGVSGLLTGAASRAAGPGDLLDGVLRARATVERHGMELLVLDQTRPDIGFPVVKVMVPGLRSFWPQYAPGRLYDVPVALGWVERPTSEDDLNPVPMFL